MLGHLFILIEKIKMNLTFLDLPSLPQVNKLMDLVMSMFYCTEMKRVITGMRRSKSPTESVISVTGRVQNLN